MPIKVCLLIAQVSQNHLKFNDSDYVTSYVISAVFYIYSKVTGSYFLKRFSGY